MHPRNPYNDRPNFRNLAAAYPPLGPYLITTPSGVTIDFKDSAAQRRLTEALLHRDFRVSLALPEDRLCPPVPNRLNYILWLEDIVEATALADPQVLQRPVWGIDVGTGASLVYPLLGCRTNPRFHFVGLDIDEKSLRYARLNAHNNDLEDRIRIVQSDPEGPMLSLAFSMAPVSSGETSIKDTALNAKLKFEFTMCNPPFYSSREEVIRSSEGKALEPSSVCHGADVEMITPGGEVAFVGKMVLETLQLRSRCRWYTSMVGKMSSLQDIVSLLRKHEVHNYAITEFVQGQTRRWALAWSFGTTRLPDGIARIPNPALQSIMPPRNTFQQTYSKAEPGHLPRALSVVLGSISNLTLRSVSDAEPSGPGNTECREVLVVASHDTWSRAARRRGDAMQVDAGAEVALVCRVRCVGDTTLAVDWVDGAQRALFESFASHLGRKVGATVAEPPQPAQGQGAV